MSVYVCVSLQACADCVCVLRGVVHVAAMVSVEGVLMYLAKARGEGSREKRMENDYGFIQVPDKHTLGRKNTHTHISLVKLHTCVRTLFFLCVCGFICVYHCACLSVCVCVLVCVCECVCECMLVCMRVCACCVYVLLCQNPAAELDQ